MCAFRSYLTVYAHLVPSDDIMIRSLEPAIDAANRNLTDNSETRLTLVRAQLLYRYRKAFQKQFFRSRGKTARERHGQQRATNRLRIT